jgi:hypothetical protein
MGISTGLDNKKLCHSQWLKLQDKQERKEKKEKINFDRVLFKISSRPKK